jgi:hypothetical protein
MWGAPAALAQVQNIGAAGGPLTGTNGTFTNQNGLASSTSAGNTVGVKLVGDWSFRPTRPPATSSSVTSTVTDRVTLPFSVGNVPVRVDTLLIEYDAKWVNGGGRAPTSGLPTPTTNMSVEAVVYEGSLNGPRPFLGFATAPTLVGNGVRLFEGTAGAFTGDLPYVLAANTDYLLALTVETNIVASDYTESTPTITVTNEYGGNLSAPTFEGYAASFTWQTVPEPGAAALALLAGLGALPRRRR